MKINLIDFVPKRINGKEIRIGMSGDKFPIGKKIYDFSGKIKEITIRRVEDLENPKSKILKALTYGNLNLNELNKETKIDYDNLRWHIIRGKNSLLKKGFVNRNKGAFNINDRNKNQEIEIKQKNPRRKELVLLNSEGKKFILSSWWTSWLKPNIENLEFDSSKNKFMYKIPENQILIQYEKSKDILYSTILPKEIDIDDEQFISTLGLLLGEMRTREGEISFSNTEPFLANYVLNSLEYFGLSKEYFKFSIQVNTKDKKPKYKDLIDYWSRELSINKNRISDIFEYENYGTNRIELGRIDFIYWNIILKEIINNLINYFLKNIENNKDYAVYMLRGLLASEGYVSASTKSGAIDRVAISSCSNENKEDIIKLLKLLNIKCSRRSNCISITSKENFNKVIEYDLLKISKDKDKFKKLYNKLKYRKDKLLSF